MAIKMPIPQPFLRIERGAQPTLPGIARTRKRTGSVDMKERIINAIDYEELRCAIAMVGKLSERGRAELYELRREIARAEIVAPENTPSDLITMNSCAELLDLDTGERMRLSVVFPCDANAEEGKVSVLAPLGTAMLGRRVDDEFEWSVPYGRRRLKVLTVPFQPEKALTATARS